MKLPKVKIVSLSLFVSSCFPGGSFFEQKAADAELENAVEVAIVGDTTSAQLSVGSTVTQKIKVPDSTSLGGASLAIPPGALTVNLTVSIEETVAITSLTDDAEVEYADYAAMGVSNSEGVESLAKPMIIQIPLSQSSALSLQASDRDKTPNAVKLRISGSQSSCKEVFILDDEFTVGPLSGSRVNGITLEKEFFGSYQPLRIAKSLYDRTQKVRDEVKRRIAAGTATAEELLSVKEGCPIVTKTAKKQLDEQSPLRFARVRTELEGRNIKFTADLNHSTPLSSCVVRMSNQFFQGKEQLKAVAENAVVSLDLKEYRPPIAGSGVMSCSFADGRMLRREFSGVKLNGLLETVWDSESRILKVYSDLPRGGDCEITGEDLNNGETINETVPNPHYYERNFSDDSEATRAQVFLVCYYADGSELKTEPHLVELEGCPTCDPATDTEPPVFRNLAITNSVLAPASITVEMDVAHEVPLREFCYSLQPMGRPYDRPIKCVPLEESSNTQFTHQASINLPGYLITGPQTWSRVEVRDIHSNAALLSVRPSETTPLKYSQFIRRGEEPRELIEEISLPIASTSVEAGGAGHDPDTTPPMFNDFLSMQDIVFSRGGPNILRYGASDNGTSVIAGENPRIDICFDAVKISNGTQVYDICGSKTKHYETDSFETHLRFPPEMQSGDYFIRNIYLIDRAGSEKTTTTTSADGSGSYDNTNGTPVFRFEFTGGTSAALAFDSTFEGDLVVDDGAVDPTSASRTVTLRNTGDATSGMLNPAIFQGENFDRFTVLSDGCQYVYLNPNDSCDIQFELDADRDGLFKGYLEVNDDDNNTSNILMVEGKAYGFAFFETVWNPSIAGETAVNFIKLPLEEDGEYDFRIEWGDGSQDYITEWNSAATTHEYAPGATPTVRITGILKGWSFNGAGDALKLTDVSDWGTMKLGNSGGYFRGCANLNFSSANAPDLADTTDMSYAFADATNFDSLLTAWDFSGVNDFSYMFYNASSFNNLGQSIEWLTTSATYMNGMFKEATSFNQAFSGLWNTSNVKDFSYMFYGATNFNQAVGAAFSTQSANTMAHMFDGAIAFDHDVGGFSLSEGVDLQNMLSNTAVSALNYELTLDGFANSSVVDITFDAANVSCNSDMSCIDARTNLRTAYNWAITDADSP